MRRVLSLVTVALLAAAPAAPAQGATKFRTYRAQMTVGFGDGGTIELAAKFQNTPKNRQRFTPRRVTRIDFESVPLSCSNDGPPGPHTTLLLTRSLQTSIPVKSARPPVARKPKPGRYAFRFTHSFADFTGTITATIDKPNQRKRGTPPRAHGNFTITDLDDGPGFTNCATNGQRGFSMPRPQGE
jgi:hypothetical protein